MATHFILVRKESYPSVAPVQVGYERCTPSHAFGPAIRTFWLLHYVVSGKGIFEIDGRRYEVEQGSFFTIPPFVETYYCADAAEPWEYIWIGFECGGELPVALSDVVHCPAAGRLFEQMRRCGELEGGRTAFLCGKLWELFSLLLEGSATRGDYIDKALSIIHAEYMNDINVQRIAAKLGLERTYFSVLFKKHTGSSPVQYLKDYRLSRAAELLEQGKSPTVAAYSVGYADIYLFSKMFKRRYGLSPRSFAEKRSAESQSEAKRGQRQA